MVSAIITTYKRTPEIVMRAAKSILNQSYKDIELIIVDDSPESYALRDKVRDMAEALGDNVLYIQHEKNLGACAARNTGIKFSKGEYVAFLDDDDEWLPEKIEKQLSVIEKNENIALVYCGRFTYYAEQEKNITQKVKFYRGKVFDKLILDNFVGSTSFPLMRKNVVEALGGFDVLMKAAQDFELWLRIASKHEIDYVKEPLVRYYVHNGEQITKNYANKVEALERINKINNEYLIKHPKAHSIRLLRMAEVCSFVEIKKARELFLTALKVHPFPSAELLKAFKWLYLKKL